MRYPFHDYTVAIAQKLMRIRCFQTNMIVPQTAAYPWLVTTQAALRKKRPSGAMPVSLQGTLHSPQTILYGIPPYQALQKLANRQARLDVLGVD